MSARDYEAGYRRGRGDGLWVGTCAGAWIVTALGLLIIWLGGGA